MKAKYILVQGLTLASRALLLTSRVRQVVIDEWNKLGWKWEYVAKKSDIDSGSYSDNTNLPDCDWYYTNDELEFAEGMTEIEFTR